MINMKTAIAFTATLDNETRAHYMNVADELIQLHDEMERLNVDLRCWGDSVTQEDIKKTFAILTQIAINPFWNGVERKD